MQGKYPKVSGFPRENINLGHEVETTELLHAGSKDRGERVRASKQAGQQLCGCH